MNDLIGRINARTKKRWTENYQYDRAYKSVVRNKCEMEKARDEKVLKICIRKNGILSLRTKKNSKCLAIFVLNFNIFSQGPTNHFLQYSEYLSNILYYILL